MRSIVDEIVREYLPFLPVWTKTLMYALAGLALVVFAYGLASRFKLYGIGPKSVYSGLAGTERGQISVKMKALFKYALAQKKLLRFPGAGVFHWSVFAGIAFLFLGTALLFLQETVLHLFNVEPFLKGPFYLTFELILDTAGAFLVLGALIALFRRLVLKPKHLPESNEALGLLALLLLIGASGFLLEGVRLIIHAPPGAAYSYIGSVFSASMLSAGFSSSSLAALYPALWWGHVLLCFSLLAALPYTRLLHLLLVPLNIFLSADGRAKAKLSMPFNILETPEEELENVKIGLSDPVALTWKEKFSLAACVNCGRCESVCPANQAGRDLSPRLVIQNLLSMCRDYERERKSESGAAELAGLAESEQSYLFARGFVSDAAAWACTNCSACMEECPALIRHVDFVIDLRRQLLSEGNADEQKMAIITGLDRNYNPYGLPSYDRYEWLEESGIPDIAANPEAEIIYWLGCAGAYDSRAREIAINTCRLLDYFKVSYAVLGSEEKCCGEPAKRLGEEGMFQLMAAENTEVLRQYAGSGRVMVNCPHCLNMLKHEYRDFGLELDVVHHSEYLLELCVKSGMSAAPLNPAVQPGHKVVYHDPCNLGRLNEVYDAPRRLLDIFCGSRLAEPPRTRDRGFCCGGGGANAWYSVPETEKISCLRVKEILPVLGQGLIAAACPYCAGMLEDAVKISGAERSAGIKDISEILAEVLLPESGTDEISLSPPAPKAS